MISSFFLRIYYGYHSRQRCSWERDDKMSRYCVVIVRNLSTSFPCPSCLILSFTDTWSCVLSNRQVVLPVRELTEWCLINWDMYSHARRLIFRFITHYVTKNGWQSLTVVSSKSDQMFHAVTILGSLDHDPLYGS